MGRPGRPGRRSRGRPRHDDSRGPTVAGAAESAFPRVGCAVTMDAMAPQDATLTSCPRGKPWPRRGPGLPPRTTAAYVLSEVDHWGTPPRSPGRLGMPVATVGDLVASTHARLARAHARDRGRRPRRTDLLPRGPADLVDGAGRPSTRESALDAISAALRRSRRRGWAIGGGALLTTVAAGIVAFGGHVGRADPRPTPPWAIHPPSANSSDGIRRTGPRQSGDRPHPARRGRPTLPRDPSVGVRRPDRWAGAGHRRSTGHGARRDAAGQAPDRPGVGTGGRASPNWMRGTRRTPSGRPLAVVDPSTTERRVIVLTEPDARALDISATATVNAKGEVHGNGRARRSRTERACSTSAGHDLRSLLRVAGRQVVPTKQPSSGGMIPHRL